MAGGYQYGVCNGQNAGANTASSVGTTITASATTNTKGAWTQLIASTLYDSCLLLVLVDGNGSTGGGNFAVDIGIGASGSEKVVANNLLVGGAIAGSTCVAFAIPLSIPAGTRVAARCQTTTASDPCQVAVVLFDGSHGEVSAGLDSIGFVSSSSEGTILTASATVDTKGSYAQLIAATARDYSALYLAFDSLNVSGSGNFLVDIAIGPAGSELVIIPNMPVKRSSGNGLATPCLLGPLPFNIPAGTRIAARCQADSASTTLGLTGYGVYK